MAGRSLVELSRMESKGRIMLKRLSEKHKTPIRDIVGRYNDPPLVAIRLEFIRQAEEVGMGSVVTARFLRRHYTTVLYHREGWRDAKYAATKARHEARHAAGL